MLDRAAITVAISLCPEEAVCYLARVYTTLVVFNPPEFIKTSVGSRVLIHSLGYPDNPESAHICKQLMDEFGFDTETFPATALQGLATIDSIFPCDRQNLEVDFEIDRQLDIAPTSLIDIQSRVEDRGQSAWLVQLKETYFLQEPIYDVLPPINTETGNIWLPQHKSHLEDFRKALRRDILRSKV
ncbi:hypothetical protein [Pseudanabaena sp. UWO310]|uniref:hypothetical protein n=1 Tax=Pseudanabaena sp. UWO310 TaxID=2480795 RepID=UPI00115AFE46|nr:hypothetical protein [Pseudanabaena sp. UWO310]TYQ28226.1 hypothetical protein PseudUWO310_14495 [Pseudanabaena sp. UWO310]